MKKISTMMAAMLIAGVAFGQSQRLVLFEEFTGETCGPCAQVNPGLNAMLNANEEKVVSIKYQNNIPSAGPRFWVYNSSEISARMTYYGNNYSPNGILDGNVFNDNAGGLDPTIINNRYVVQSPFTVNVEHSFSAGNDSIYVTAVFKATQAYSGTNLVAQIAVTERDIFGYTSPNGENHYEGVMRKMLPNASGTTLPAVWNAGDSIVLNYSWYITPAALSSPVYYQLSVVGFIQENSNKEVLQAGFSRAQVPLDPKAKGLQNLNDVVCTGSVTPSVDVFNNGITDITSLDILYKLDNGANTTYNWTGVIPSFTSLSIALPNLQVLSNGSHSVTAQLSNPNAGATDNNLLNNISKRFFGVPGPALAGNVIQDFAAATFPPANWMRVDQTGDNLGWSRVAAGFNGAGSAKMDFYNSPGGNIDNLYLNTIDMTGANSATLTFDVAHRQYSAAYVDLLNVEVSTDCGTTWNNVWSKSGPQLATVAGYTTGAFTPTSAQWRNESVSLSSFVGSSSVLVRFNAVSAFGNNAYIDNVNLTITTGINEEILESSLSVFPNPANDVLNISAKLNSSDDVTITIYDLTGRVVYTSSVSNVNSINNQIDVKQFAKGTYLLEVSTTEDNIVRKVTVE